MVIMGGGPEAPHHVVEKGRDLLLCVLPWPQGHLDKIIKALQEKYPQFEIVYFEVEPRFGSKAEVPEGKARFALDSLISDPLQ